MLTGSYSLKITGHSTLPGKLGSAFPFLSVMCAKTTEKYEHLRRGDLKQAYELFSPGKRASSST